MGHTVLTDSIEYIYHVGGVVHRHPVIFLGSGAIGLWSFALVLVAPERYPHLNRTLDLSHTAFVWLRVRKSGFASIGTDLAQLVVFLQGWQRSIQSLFGYIRLLGDLSQSGR